VSEKIGANNPPFDPMEIVNLDILAQQLKDKYADLFAQRDMFVSGAEKWITAHSDGISDDNQQALATEIVAQLMSMLDECHGKPNSAHTIAKSPFLQGGRIVDNVLNSILAEPLRAAIKNMRGPMTDYAREKAKMASALIDPMDEPEQAKSTLSASQTRGDLGGMSSLRGQWRVSITDEQKIPVAYMHPNMEMLTAKMNSSKDKTGKPTAYVSGVEWIYETSLVIRK
jgi:hypothetical protein